MAANDQDDFRAILERAVAGSHNALKKIFAMYESMLDDYATWNGEVDEDLRQYIMIRIALKISKFDL